MPTEVVRRVDVKRIDDPSSLDWLRGFLGEWCGDSQWLAVDVETRSDVSNLEDWHDSSRIVSVSFSPSADQAFVMPLSHPAAPWAGEWAEAAREVFEHLRGAQLVAHHSKFDLRWIESRTGVDLSPWLAWDTMDAAYILDVNQPLGLKRRAVDDLGVDPWDDVDLDDAEQAHWPDLARYNGLDTAHTFALAEWQRERLRGPLSDQGRVLWHVQLPALRALFRAERNGLLVDLDEVERRRAEAVDTRDRLYQEFEAQVPGELAVRFQESAAYGGERLFDVGPPTEKERLSLAPTSKFFKQYAELAWPVLECSPACECQDGSKPHPAPSWDSSVMTRLAARGFDDARILSEYRKVDKQLSTYLNRWPDDVADDGRIRATYKTTSTRTGRLSCEGPNLQQVDRTLKTCFVSPPGWLFVQADYSQIEVRFAAWLSEDENLRRVYREGGDVYVETAAAVNGIKPEEVTKDQRQKAKPVVLGFLYGMLAPSFVVYARDTYGIHFEPDEAEEARDAFFRLYPGLLAYHERMRRHVRKHKQVETPFGFVRRLPEIDSQDRKRRWGAERQAINTPIQGAGGQLMLMALAAIHEQTDPDECRSVGTVHDSSLLEVREDVADAVLDKVGGLMLDPPALRHFFPAGFPVPLAVELEVGRRWGDPERVIEMDSLGS